MAMQTIIMALFVVAALAYLVNHFRPRSKAVRQVAGSSPCGGCSGHMGCCGSTPPARSRIH